MHMGLPQDVSVKSERDSFGDNTSTVPSWDSWPQSTRESVLCQPVIEQKAEMVRIRAFFVA